MKKKILALILTIITFLLISCNQEICPTYSDVGPYGHKPLKTYKK